IRAPRGALIDSGETVRAQPEVAGRERCFEEATRPTIPNRPTPRTSSPCERPGQPVGFHSGRVGGPAWNDRALPSGKLSRGRRKSTANALINHTFSIHHDCKTTS